MTVCHYGMRILGRMVVEKKVGMKIKGLQLLFITECSSSEDKHFLTWNLAPVCHTLS